MSQGRVYQGLTPVVGLHPEWTRENRTLCSMFNLGPIGFFVSKT